MKSKRSIRLFFSFVIMMAVLLFLIGYACGRQAAMRILPKQEQLETEAQKEKQAAKDNDMGFTGDESGKTDGQDKQETEDLSQTMSDASVSAAFYLKNTGEYLTVFDASTGEIYFETDLRKEQLPENWQKECDEEGIPFSSLEDLYHFLENYSS